LLPGMLAKAKVKTTSLKNQVIIPRHTILEKEKGRVVFVITKNNIATERNVILGQVYKKNAQILSGLQFGDQLIIAGHQRLVPNETVNIIQ
ncbi:MAG: membrane fusion protein (multidrug efflux system), partial [bacterium]